MGTFCAAPGTVAGGDHPAARVGSLARARAQASRTDPGGAYCLPDR
jgi:hypothetical protein